MLWCRFLCNFGVVTQSPSVSINGDIVDSWSYSHKLVYLCNAGLHSSWEWRLVRQTTTNHNFLAGDFPTLASQHTDQFVEIPWTLHQLLCTSAMSNWSLWRDAFNLVILCRAAARRNLRHAVQASQSTKGPLCVYHSRAFFIPTVRRHIIVNLLQDVCVHPYSIDMCM